jgi:hypothetical protein
MYLLQNGKLTLTWYEIFVVILYHKAARASHPASRTHTLCTLFCSDYPAVAPTPSGCITSAVARFEALPSQTLKVAQPADLVFQIGRFQFKPSSKELL